jgi:hypothetical protein
MNDAQTWTLIGGFLAILVAMNALVLAIVRSEIEGLRKEMRAIFDGLRTEMIARFEGVYRELGHEGDRS